MGGGRWRRGVAGQSCTRAHDQPQYRFCTAFDHQIFIKRERESGGGVERERVSERERDLNIQHCSSVEWEAEDGAEELPDGRKGTLREEFEEVRLLSLSLKHTHTHTHTHSHTHTHTHTHTSLFAQTP